MRRVASMKLMRVLRVLLEPGGDRQDVRVEDDVARIEAHLLGEEPVGALADLDLALGGVGLPGLVEGHHDDAGAVALHQAGLARGSRPRLPSG